ncbi:hypothetical protein TrVE_jg14068 [Triparma verrucosa]|uniref:DUF547 domain-containing protein n=1 Tax=Triparma verrucosa TaxID=1606542 RepID=A0A9W7BYJ9_9STRA|nr:hypothetical protein TrVE_jg14068 [Triparma verrucosa]
MIKLAERFTVPQCFVGETHIGGYDEFVNATHEGGKLKSEDDLPQAFKTELASLPDALRAVDPSLKVVIPPPPPYANQLPDLAKSIETARLCSTTPLYSPLILSGTTPNESLHPSILNCLYRYNDRVDPNPDLLILRLKSTLDSLITSHTTSVGVDYPSLKSSPDFLSFEIATSELQSLSFSSMSLSCKKSCVINLYNLMIKHAFTKVGIPTSKKNRGPFFTTVGYALKSGFYSFDHLENGILRSNRNSILKPSDTRLLTILDDSSVDPRIHFALNCGAKSCPPIKKFTKEAVEEELEVTAKGYCEDDGNVKVEGGKVTLNMIFNWYGKDFGNTEREKVEKIRKWCVGEKGERVDEALGREDFSVEYFVYDWGCDGVKPDVPFDEETGYKKGLTLEHKWE